jgi:hypothetical protein
MGDIDDWMDIGGPDSLEKIAKKHLGSESFFELY